MQRRKSRIKIRFSLFLVDFQTFSLLAELGHLLSVFPTAIQHRNFCTRFYASSIVPFHSNFIYRFLTKTLGTFSPVFWNFYLLRQNLIFSKSKVVKKYRKQVWSLVHDSTRFQFSGFNEVWTKRKPWAHFSQNSEIFNL